jgi:tetratricopeptide (TPR) repeat protein
MSDTRIVTCLVLILSALPTFAQQSSENMLRNAQAKLDRGAFAEAIAALPQPMNNSAPAVLADIQRIRAESLIGQGSYAEARTAARSALELSRPLGAERIADALFLLARVQVLLGGTAQQTALEEAMTAAAAVDGADGPRALRVKDRVALVLSVDGKSAEAEQMMREILKTRRRSSVRLREGQAAFPKYPRGHSAPAVEVRTCPRSVSGCLGGAYQTAFPPTPGAARKRA